MGMRTFLILTLALGAGTLAACESEFASDPTRPRATRAVQSPVDQGTSIGEIMGSTSDAVPLLRVDTANKKDEPPHVYTIIDGVREMSGETPTARPKTEPATLPAPARVDPVTGPQK